MAGSSLGCLVLALLLQSTLASLDSECPQQSSPVGKGGSDAAPATTGGTFGSALVQRRTVMRHGVNKAGHEEEGGSDCARRLNHFSTRPAACIVIQDNKALLVKVPYGRSPGWDLPGGMHHHGEAACETAEREVCEESGYSVRAIAKLTGSVFRCEITGSNVCTKPVDEGFLQKGFFSVSDLDGLKFRGGSWGDKVGLLREQLGSSPAPSLPEGTPDACGCRSGIEGWSTTTQQCATTSQTSPTEAMQCQRTRGSAEFDVCGCRKGVNGWSSTRQRCSTTSDTSPEEAAWCNGQAA
eukprot:CAMPEP_0179042560 /NCGR_PEP_ID=MMETSP0796-20121207/16722_1 /TAXON_ID=73915 /ORGANISM="Pyrodinium bahamense, Strain pbaha01" /LENGTH=295 /DNA_ID=CAMNT_0020738933 /DNA_START=67 /DNA_END=954 /DNA_ORIENTATION=+